MSNTIKKSRYEPFLRLLLTYPQDNDTGIPLERTDLSYPQNTQVLTLTLLLAVLLAGCAAKNDTTVRQYRWQGVVHCVYSRNGAVIGEITGNESAIKEGHPCPK